MTRMRLIKLVWWVALLAPLTALADSFRDDFNTFLWTNNDGTRNWTAAWDVTGSAVLTGTRLRLQNQGTEVRRAADLSGYLSATLRLSYTTGGELEGNDRLAVQVSPDGATWTTLEEFQNDASGTVARSWDISAYLSATTWVRLLVTRNTTGTEYFFFDFIEIDAITSAPVASYAMDEIAWTGAAAEVADASGYGNAGSARGGATTADTSPAVPGTPGTCRYGSFDGVNDYVRVEDGASLDISGAITLMAWIRHRTDTHRDWEAIITKGDSAYRLHLNGGCNINGSAPNADDTRRYGITLGMNGGCADTDLNSGVVPQANVWYHVAGTFDGSTARIYVNGTQRNSASIPSGTIATNDYPLYIGENAQQTGRHWHGDIDEVRIYPRALSAAEVVAAMNETRACQVGVSQFRIVHDGSAINCLVEPITISARDAAGQLVTSYTGTVLVSTGTGRGTWSLLAGNGTLTQATPDGGVASYSFVASDNGQVELGLYYPEGAASMNLSVTDGVASDDDTEGTLSFGPSGFVFTAAPHSIPPNQAIPAQTAGTDFDLYLTAYGQTPDDPQCGVIESYTGAKSIRLWSEYLDPLTGSRVLTIDGAAIAASEGAATARSIVFSGGTAALLAKYKDVGSIRIAAKDDTVTEPVGGIRGGTLPFVVRPASLELYDITRTSDGAANPGTTASGLGFVAAGEPFSASVRALDAEGHPTPNFGQESTAEGVELLGTLAMPVAGANPPITNAAGFGVFSGGAARGTSFAWPQVGTLDLQAHIADGDYLGTGDVSGLPVRVGRFHPHHFRLVSSTLTPFCGGAGGFNYMDQDGLGLAYVLHAVTATGAVLGNYDAALGYPVGAAALVAKDEDATASPDRSARLSSLVTSAWQAGRYSFSDPSALFARQAGGVPDGPIERLGIGLTVNDLDGVQIEALDMRADTVGDCAATSSCNARQLGLTRVRYGRIALKNANGTELLPLSVPLAAEYFSGSGFVTNGEDVCTALTLAGQLRLSNPQTAGGAEQPGDTTMTLGAGTTTAILANSPLAAGEAGLQLSAPGAGNTGYVDLRGELGAAFPWLQFDWNGDGSYTDDPRARASFGVYSGSARRIYVRELY